MKIVLTGTPGTGKTELGKKLSEELGIPVLNEKDFALKIGIGKWDHEENELEVPLKKLQSGMEKELKNQKSLILEGHLLCEIKLPVDLVIVLRTHPELLETRLEYRRYKPEKLADNVFVEGIDYCLKHSLRNYPKKSVVEIRNEKGIKEALGLILEEVNKRGLI